ncbi:MAG: hypothetical protein K0R37_1612 [Arthrobacter sp.]|nr:hypothetical protein [Arthrobacter sp.]MCE3244467.1 hypothetical protein [Arthrobacter sp.]
MSIPQRVRTAAVVVPPRLVSARTMVTCRDGPGLVVQVQLPRALMEAVPIRVAVLPGDVGVCLCCPFGRAEVRSVRGPNPVHRGAPRIAEAQQICEHPRPSSR